jgi:hypothetical protein
MASTFFKASLAEQDTSVHSFCQLQCNQAREQNFLKSQFLAKNYIDKPSYYQNGHNNQN